MPHSLSLCRSVDSLRPRATSPIFSFSLTQLSEVKKGKLSTAEWATLVEAHDTFGNRWSEISKRLPGRTANSLKNFWHSNLKNVAIEQLFGKDAVAQRQVKEKNERDGLVFIDPEGRRTIVPRVPEKSSSQPAPRPAPRSFPGTPARMDNLYGFSGGFSSLKDFSVDAPTLRLPHPTPPDSSQFDLVSREDSSMSISPTPVNLKRSFSSSFPGTPAMDVQPARSPSFSPTHSFVYPSQVDRRSTPALTPPTRTMHPISYSPVPFPRVSEQREPLPPLYPFPRALPEHMVQSQPMYLSPFPSPGFPGLSPVPMSSAPAPPRMTPQPVAMNPAPLYPLSASPSVHKPQVSRRQAPGLQALADLAADEINSQKAMDVS
eukprot:TRINITY_DN1982_c0_g1_i3.p1 TRINITY_DN1982_c0_g1~~TRINITY_DN1982_c0_g1_i3.p1  ORF type:complete len:375 (-),score=73.00 TRINITY_DN1982_c0_g1_i3:108-1232(-)